MMTRFQPSRAAALERLSSFLPKAGRVYASRRNYDLGPSRHTHVSCLSPYLRCRLITEEEVLQAVLGRHSYQASEKFVQEVFWRTYWKGWLEMRPAVWHQYLRGVSRAWDDVQTQSGLRQKWEDACSGKTGIDCFDAWAQELTETGYLHNHARMWFASIWIFTLELPWELGADFFLRHLLDGDPASNTLGWRWVAGIQTPGKTYMARTSNISKYTEGRFHPKWKLASEAPALSGPEPQVAQPIPELPEVNRSLRTGFLWHEEDLSPSFMLSHVTPVASAVLSPQTTIGPLQPASQVAVFRHNMLQDAIGRHADRMPTLSPVASVRDILTWASKEGLEQIITPYAPVGPVASLLAELINSSDGPVISRVMRSYDARAWPYAERGFFPFKKHLPDLAHKVTSPEAA